MKLLPIYFRRTLVKNKFAFSKLHLIAWLATTELRLPLSLDSPLLRFAVFIFHFFYLPFFPSFLLFGSALPLPLCRNSLINLDYQWVGM